MDYLIGFVYEDDIEPTVYYTTAEFKDNEEEAIAWAKRRFTPIEIVSVEEVEERRF